MIMIDADAMPQEPGGYSYMDFVRVGLPLNIITMVAAIVAITIFFPF